MRYKWYLSDGNGKTDTVFLTKSQFASMVEGGGADEYSLVWREGYPEWVDLRVIKNKIIARDPLKHLKKSDQENYHAQETNHEHERRPWSRYFARVIDFYLLGFIFAIVLIALKVPQPSDLPLYVVAWPILIVYETIMIGTWGATVGKKVMGVHVLSKNYGGLSFSKSIRRSFYVWMNGYWFGLPLILLYPNIKCYNDIKNSGEASWDKRLDLQVVYSGRTWVRHIIFWIILSSPLLLLILMASLKAVAIFTYPLL